MGNLSLEASLLLFSEGENWNHTQGNARFKVIRRLCYVAFWGSSKKEKPFILPIETELSSNRNVAYIIIGKKREANIKLAIQVFSPFK